MKHICSNIKERLEQMCLLTYKNVLAYTQIQK